MSSRPFQLLTTLDWNVGRVWGEFQPSSPAKSKTVMQPSGWWPRAFGRNISDMVLIACFNPSLVRSLELWSVSGGKRLTTHYFGIGLRHCADRVIFPVGGMSGRSGEFLSPSLENDPLPFVPQIIRSTGPSLLESKMAIHRRHGQLEGTKGRPSFCRSRSCEIL